MNKELYVSTTPHETKVALVEDDQLAEVYFERENEYTLAGSIYKGRVTRVLPGMQSAFVDIGLERDAFLYVSDFLELQDEDEDGEFGDLKVTGATLAQANGLIITEPQPAEEDDSEEPRKKPSADGEEDKTEGKDEALRAGVDAAAAVADGVDATACTDDRPVEAQPGIGDSEDWRASRTVPAIPMNAPPRVNLRPPAPREPKRRQLRGFEPRGLVVHGLARSVDEEEIEPEVRAEAADAAAADGAAAAPAAISYTPMLLPGESISKYNRPDGEAPAPAPAAESGASQESDRGYGRGRDGSRPGWTWTPRGS